MKQPIRQRGFSFTEVLIALMVLGVSVLAFAGLQARALQATGTSHQRAQAMQLATDLTERIRANPAALTTYQTTTNYNGASTPSGAPSSWGTTCIKSSVSGTGCSATTMATYDINEIEYMADQLLPSGQVQAKACPTDTSLHCIFVSWGGTAVTSCVDNTSTNCVAMRVSVK